jgi:hypothetical protein
VETQCWSRGLTSRVCAVGSAPCRLPWPTGNTVGERERQSRLAGRGIARVHVPGVSDDWGRIPLIGGPMVRSREGGADHWGRRGSARPTPTGGPGPRKEIWISFIHFLDTELEIRRKK